MDTLKGVEGKSILERVKEIADLLNCEAVSLHVSLFNLCGFKDPEEGGWSVEGEVESNPIEEINQGFIFYQKVANALELISSEDQFLLDYKVTVKEASAGSEELFRKLPDYLSRLLNLQLEIKNGSKSKDKELLEINDYFGQLACVIGMYYDRFIM